MGVKEWLYEECPCGSGKKLKFCCWPEVRDEVSGGDTHDRLVEAVRNLHQPPGLTNTWTELSPSALLRADEALQLMREGQDAKAAEGFREARKSLPGLYALWNNEAMAWWRAGKYEKARRLLEECLKYTGAINAFGWGMLAEMRYGTGKEEGAAEAAERAVALCPVSRDAASKTAAALAMLGRDEEVVRYVEGCGFEEAKVGCFHAGVASANLGRREEALAWLEWAEGENLAMNELRGKIVADLKAGKRAEDLPEGRWPHWCRASYDLGGYVQTEAMTALGGKWSAVACDLMSMALYEGTLKAGDALALLHYLKGMRATAMRERLEAHGATETAQPPFATKDEAKEFFVNAVLNMDGLTFQTIEFSENMEMEDPIPEEDIPAYEKAIEALRKKDPSRAAWKTGKATLMRLAEGHPGRYRVRLNLAGMLMLEGKEHEAEERLEQLFEEFPSYGFAAAGLLRLAVERGDLDKADEICRKYRPAKKMPPEEYLDWLDALEPYLELCGEEDLLENVRETAKDLWKELGIPEPKPLVKKFWEKIVRELGGHPRRGRRR